MGVGLSSKGWDSFIFFFYFFHVYLFLKEHGGGEGKREETQNLKQTPGSGAVRTEPAAGLKLTNCEIMT